MARSEYIYILQVIEDGTILAARTVKRELVGYIHNCGWGRELMEKACQVLRLPDRNHTEAYVYDWSEIPEKP
jgi:hypothetical protein